jgi:DNA-binding NtrC family response regulator
VTEPHRRAGKVVVVEDDPSISESISLLLADEGFGNVVVVATVADACRELALPDQPLVVLLDTLLRDGDAETVLDALVARRPSPPTVLVTGSVRGRGLADSYGIMCVDKPFDLDVLLEAIDRAILERRTPVPPSTPSDRGSSGAS